MDGAVTVYTFSCGLVQVVSQVLETQRASFQSTGRRRAEELLDVVVLKVQTFKHDLPIMWKNVPFKGQEEYYLSCADFLCHCASLMLVSLLGRVLVHRA